MLANSTSDLKVSHLNPYMLEIPNCIQFSLFRQQVKKLNIITFPHIQTIHTHAGTHIYAHRYTHIQMDIYGHLHIYFHAPQPPIVKF